VLPTLVLGLAGTAWGAPSRWREIADPGERRIDRALTRAIQARASRDLAPESLPVAEALFALRAATVLELAGGEQLARPDVWFFLGDALIVGDHGDDERGRGILEKALSAAPDSPMAGRAFRDVAVASSRLSEFDVAVSAANEALRVEWDEARRAEIVLLRAGARMALGDLPGARRDYEAIVSTTAASEPNTLAKWGLGVALARAGDLPGGLRYAAAAAETRFSDSQGNVVTVLEVPSVKLTPEYDAFYYRALAAQAAAAKAETAEKATSELEWAVSLLKRYLAAARFVRDRYVEIAEQSLRSCERRLREGRTRPSASGGASWGAGARPRQ
jgi:tetratricopeptide (TPR) repeat protein